MSVIRHSDDEELAKQLATTGEGGGDSASFPILPIAATLAVGLLVLAFIFWPRPAPVPEIMPTVVALVPTAVPVPTVEVSKIDTYVALIDSHSAKGEYLEAQSVAQAALEVQGLRSEERRILNGYIVSLGLRAIESTVFEPLDAKQHQSLVDTYLSLRERARVSAVVLESPLQIAKRAHAASQFPLAKVAIEEAHTAGLFDPNLNRDVTRLYISILYGLGQWYTTAEQSSPLYEQGLRALVASDEIADHYQTGQSEAEALLKSLGHPSPSSWPQPLDTPLLP